MPRVELAQLDLPANYLAQLRELLARHIPDAEVWAYGSRVNGDAHEGSDLDLVLRNPDQPQQDVDNWFELKEALQESSLPMLVEIHLWSRLPQTFHPEIERRHVVLQSGRPDPAKTGGAGL